MVLPVWTLFYIQDSVLFYRENKTLDKIYYVQYKLVKYLDSTWFSSIYQKRSTIS